MSTVAEVRLWGRTIGAVSLATGADVADFEYEAGFTRSTIEPSPIVMPLARRVYSFPELSRQTFHGLPGLLADSLPDKYGHLLIDAWLAAQGRTPDSFNVIERLCYTGERGMGALEFRPTTGPDKNRSRSVDIDQLVQLASNILTQRNTLQANLVEGEQALSELLRVGTSAGGARAKAVIAWNPITNEVRSGQVPAAKGFQYWLLKFDGVTGNRDKELEDATDYGTIEYAYSQMARDCGIKMADCRLFEENGRRHFMTRRFDRLENGAKLHMQSLCALAHFDFNLAGAYSYEQALLVMRQLELPMEDTEQMFRRIAFNVLARNQDDHAKNIAFLMDKSGAWSLAPAFDLTYSYNPAGAWTAQHQMSLNGKRDDFTPDDFKACGSTAALKRGRASAIVREVFESVRRWPEFAEHVGLGTTVRDAIQRSLQVRAQTLGFGRNT